MNQHKHNTTRAGGALGGRRGVVAIYAAICMVVLLGMAALAVDIGMLYATQAQLE